MAGRRALAFASLDEVIPDVERLLAGHVTVGRWSLGQICHHLGLAFRGSVEGIPRRSPWLARKTVGVVGRRLLFATGWMPEGVRVPKVYLPRSGLDAAAEAAALRAALTQFQAFTGPPAEHPLLGPFSRAEWERFHRIHCAHHLSFAVPT